MKFFVFALFALVAVASARNIDLSLGGFSSGTSQLARQVAPLLLQQTLGQRSNNLQTLNLGSLGLNSAQLYGAPQQQVFTIQAPVQAQTFQTVAVQPIQAPVQQQNLQLAYVVAQPQPQQSYGPIQAAVQTTRSVQFVDVPSTGAVAQPQSIVIGPSVQPLDFEFQSQSSPISVRQTHIPGTPNQPQESSHTDEPDILRQTIVKPIIHEVNEAVQPVRRISQEVRPVQETVSQLITRGEQRQVQQVQAVPVQVQAVAVEAAPTVVEAAPVVETAPVELVATEQVVSTVAQAAPVVETVAQAAPQTVLLITEGNGLNGLQGQIGQTATLPVNARITRFRR